MVEEAGIAVVGIVPLVDGAVVVAVVALELSQNVETQVVFAIALRWIVVVVVVVAIAVR